MTVDDVGKQLRQLQDELACLHAAEQHIQEKIDTLLAELNNQLEQPEASFERGDLGDLPQMLRRFETEHPALTDSINRVMVTLGNIGI